MFAHWVTLWYEFLNCTWIQTFLHISSEFCSKCPCMFLHHMTTVFLGSCVTGREICCTPQSVKSKHKTVHSLMKKTSNYILNGKHTLVHTQSTLLIEHWKTHITQHISPWCGKAACMVPHKGVSDTVDTHTNSFSFCSLVVPYFQCLGFHIADMTGPGWTFRYKMRVSASLCG